MQEKYAHIPAEKFEFAQLGETLHDEKLKTKSRGYFADAFLRFKKNKSSVVAACIIGLLVLFAIVSPILSPYSVYDQASDYGYKSYAPYVESVAKLGIGILDGGKTLNSQNELQMNILKAKSAETGYDVIIGTPKEVEKTEKYRGQDIVYYVYSVKVNSYVLDGVTYKTVSYDEYQKIQEYQNATGVQVLYPYVEAKDVYVNAKEGEKLPYEEGNAAFSNVWYQCADSKGNPLFDENGDFIPAYSTNQKIAGDIPYTSQRIEGDDGSYIYSRAVSGALQVRVCYYNYYKYKVGHAPQFLFGTDSRGRDLFCAIGTGARFSLVFAVIVSAINLTIGAIYGAIQGYYGGIADLLMDRFSDILSGVPSIVVMTLFQLHLAEKLGVVPSFLFAYVLTGWIGMAGLTRKQFYRFKNQEYVMAARTLGASDKRLMFKHIFPNSLGTMVTSCVLVIPGVISSETSLTYLKIIDLSKFVGTSIGELMSLGQANMSTAPHAMFFPAMFLSLLLISFNLFGNGLRDAFNPSTRGEE